MRCSEVDVELLVVLLGALSLNAETHPRGADDGQHAFGDGAGAAVVSAEGNQLLSMVQGSDGAGGMALKCETRPVNKLYRQLGAQN